MASQPSTEDVETLVSMTGVSSSEAIARLKGNNNNLSQAVNEYFDDPSSMRYRWDESEFGMDRDGNANDTGISFNVYGPQEDPTQTGNNSGSYHGGIAPPISRPPSRTNNQSPMSRIIDLTAESSGVMDADREDVELQRALHASAQEAGLAPQESGVATSDGAVAFGPANRSYYEAGKWDLVTVNPPTDDIFLDPEPAERQRDDGAPAFLRSRSQNRLGSLLTIYHEIPLAREIFLGRHNIPSDIGFHERWWSGTPIEAGSASEDGSFVPTNDAHNFLLELKRLMAFLDRTDRSYGSVDGLAGFDNTASANPETGFFETWQTWNVGNPRFRSIFSRGVQPRGFDEEPDAEEEGQDFAILDLMLPSQSNDEDIETLYDLADKLLWETSGLELDTSAYLPIIADVISFRLYSTESTIKLDIPSVWYPDRYLSSGREAALNMRKQKEAVRESMQQISNLEHKLSHWQTKNGKILQVKDLFEAALRHNADALEDEPLSDEEEMEDRSGELDLSVELHKVMRSVDEKLAALEVERQKARDTLRELSRLYTGPKDGEPPLHPYTLCGVSLNSTTTYLRRQAEPDLIDMSLDQDAPSSPPFQWWKISLNAGTERPVTVEKVTEDFVLQTTKEEGQSPILVYASEAALAEPFQPLPEPLEKFVEKDNEVFKRELGGAAAPSSPVQVSSPGKRKYEETPSSSESTRWQPGSGIKVSHCEVHGAAETETEGNEGVWNGWNREQKQGSTEDTPMTLDDRVSMGESTASDTSSQTLAAESRDSGPAREMQEMGSGGGLMGFHRPTPADGGLGEKMRLQDMDEVMSDIDAKEESEAVKELGMH